MKNQTGRGLFRFVAPPGPRISKRYLRRSSAVVLLTIGAAALLQIPGIGSTGAGAFTVQPTFGSSSFGSPTFGSSSFGSPTFGSSSFTLPGFTLPASTFPAPTPASQGGSSGSGRSTVGQASAQKITFASNPPTNPKVGGTYTASATGGGSGNPVIFSIDASSSPSACSISGSTVSFTGAGTCVVDANQAGTVSYSAAPQVQQSFVIVAASPPPPAVGSAAGFSQMTPGAWTVGQDYGGWNPVFNGYGSIGITADPGVGNVLTLAPEIATAPSYTHSALVTTAATLGNLNFSVQVQTVRQLRQGSAPNPWEVGWVFWHYTDNTHFYYFILKPNGWELGKEDPAYPGNQRFLATGPSPAMAVGSWHTVQVQQVGATMSVSVDGNPVVTFTDTKTPYLSGSVGLYCEDSVVNFANPSITSLH